MKETPFIPTFMQNAQAYFAPRAATDRAAPRRWPEFRTPDDFVVRVGEFVTYATLVLGHSPATAQWYRDGAANLRHFIASRPADLPIVLSPGYLEEWIAWNRTRGLSHRSVRTYWMAMKRFTRDVCDRDRVDNPFASVRAPGAGVRVHKALKPSECERILSAAINCRWLTPFEQTRNVAIIATALYAGLRKNEILRLQTIDVDLTEGVIHVVRGKGRNGGKDRTAYVPAELSKLLMAYLHQRKLWKVETPEFFSSRKLRRGVPPATLRKVVERVRAAAGIAFSLHTLRHSFVTMLLRSGVPIHVVRDLAGHQNIQTTEGYARVFDEDKRRHIEKLRFTDPRRALSDEVLSQVAR